MKYVFQILQYAILILSIKDSWATKQEENDFCVHDLGIPLTNVMNGETRYLNNFEKNTILMTFWAPWSINCSGILENLIALQKSLKNSSLKIIVITGDKKLLKKVHPYQLNDIEKKLEILVDQNNQLFHSLKIRSIPSSVIINSEGKLLILIKGNINWNKDKYRNILLEYLNMN